MIQTLRRDRVERPTIDTAHLRLFGCFGLVVGASTVNLGASSQRLIAYLGLHGPSLRVQVAGTLWPDVDDKHALGSLRTALWRVPRSYPQVISTHGAGIQLNEHVTVDVVELTRDIHHLLHDIHGPGSPVRQLPMEATVLPGWYDDWVLTARERLRQLHLFAVETLAETQLARGDHAAALESALTAVEIDPLRERAHRTIIRVHLDMGNTAEAIRTYAHFRDRLLVEMHVPPSREIATLMQDLHPEGEETKDRHG